MDPGWSHGKLVDDIVTEIAGRDAIFVLVRLYRIAVRTRLGYASDRDWYGKIGVLEWEAYKEGPHKKWDVDPESTYMEGSTVESEWEDLEDEDDDKGRGKKQRRIRCNYCSKVTRGGITRHKHHLTGDNRDVAKCIKVPEFVKQTFVEHFAMKKRVKESMESIPHFDESVLEEQEQDEENEHGKRPVVNPSQQLSKKSKQLGPINLYFQPSGQTIGKKGGNQVGSSQFNEAQKKLRFDAVRKFCRWMYDAGISFNALRYDSLGPAIEAIGVYGSGMKPPTYHEARVPMLKQEINHTKLLLKDNEIEKSVYGCSLMADGWRDRKGRSLINFLINTPRGSMFVESVDASSYSHTGQKMFELLDRFIQRVGPDDVVQVVTGSASNNVLAGKLLEDKYPHLYWTPCAAHCLDLIFEDIFKLPDLKRTFERAVQINTYIYNRIMVLNMMRDFTGHRDMVRPATTRFATAFLTPSRFQKQKKNLRSMFTSDIWTKSKFAKEIGGKQVINIIMMPSFWNSVVYAVKVAGPLIKVLRLVDGEKKPPMGYIYEAIDRAKEEIGAAFGNNENRYIEIFNIIDNRWDCQLHRPLHAVGYYLNPAYYYKNGEVEKDAEVKEGLFSCIKRLSRDEKEEVEIHNELVLYTKALKLFGISMAIKMRDTYAPAHWWSQYGTSAPTLQKFAIKVLSLTCSSSGCERNWSVFEHLHSKKRNRLEQQKLNDLVYIKYNRALRRRYDCRDTIDPIILDETSVVDPNEWLAEIFDDEEGDALVHDGDDLTWGDVARAAGVHESLYNLRKTQDSCANKGGNEKGSSSASKSKGKGKMQLIDEEEFNFDEESEEEKDAETYKACDVNESDSDDDDFGINILDD
ncbi:hypothetical protein OROGR_020760 [Orobanche gracilis]